MPVFVVVNEQGPAWIEGRPMREQPGWSEHAEFMDALEAERFVVLGGPLRGGARHRALLVVQGADEPSVRRRLATDPWLRSGTLRLLSLEPWEVRLGKLA